MSDTIVIAFGRLNPPTSGHEKLVNKVRSVARKVGGDPAIYLSHTQDAKKNPFDYSTKIKYAQKAFGEIIKRTKSTTLIQILQEVEAKGYKNVFLVFGSDRVKGMQFTIKANGKDYNFDTMKIVSAGQRDPDAEGVEGMSASKMRAAAKTAENVDATWVDEDGKEQPSFRSGLPKLLQTSAEQVWKDLRKAMKL